jgi:alpha-2-macroglobulin
MSRAYAFYVLAQNGQVNISDLRYFSDTKVGAMTSALAAALTGAAASQVGDRARATYGFNKARDIIARASESGYARANTGRDLSYEYESLLRDVSGVIALAADSGRADLVPFLMERSRLLTGRIQNTSTQEKGWMLRAAYALTRQRVPLNIAVNGAPAPVRDNAVRLTPVVAQLDNGITLTNRGDASVSVAVSGTPTSAQPAMANGATINKSIWTTSGAPADLSSLRQNDRVIVEISGTVPEGAYRQMGVIDLLPAGLEIEQPLRPDSAKAYKFLSPLTSANMQDARDDRYVASFTLYTGYRRVNRDDVDTSRSFHIAYVARAISVGKFALPAAVVEDMYAPAVRARTSMGQVTIGK